MKKSLASDNYSGVHPTIMEAIISANTGHVSSYGHDEYSEKAVELFRQHFGQHVEVYFVFLGTAANVLSISSAIKPYEAVLCTELAHINTDECGAPERFGGFKLLSIPTANGKFEVDKARRYLSNLGFEHNVQPKLISISQTTELGTVYSVDEIREIANFAHSNGMYLHVDGARLSNAAAALGLPFREFTTDLGVDVISFGGTKNGMMLGEAIIFNNTDLAHGFRYLRKQSMQLASKMRFISAQFIAYLTNNHCLSTAMHANQMAAYLRQRLEAFPQVRITQSVDANAVFAIIPKEINEALLDCSFFYFWNEEANEARWMTSWDTTKDDIDRFIETLDRALK